MSDDGLLDLSLAPKSDRQRLERAEAAGLGGHSTWCPKHTAL